MAREIKFRGRNILNNDWMYGDLIHDDEHCRVYVYPRDAGPLGLQHRADADTIGQFTGLHDKNGKDIYEGDIVKCDEFVYKVAYNDKRFASFVLIRKQDMFRHYFGEAMDSSACEVIGNIYDNPELLKEDGV